MNRFEIIGAGAEAKLYKTSMFGREIVVKKRMPKGYRAYELDLKIRKNRTKTEARIMFRLSKNGIRCPKIVAFGRFSIYMERISGTLLKDKRIAQNEITDAARTLAKMHCLDIVHGDFTPANLISDGDSVCVIDFGLSGMTSSDEEKAIDLLLMKRSLNKNLYHIFEREYAKNSRDSEKILKRLKEVEKRGRYQIRTLT